MRKIPMRMAPQFIAMARGPIRMARGPIAMAPAFIRMGNFPIAMAREFIRMRNFPIAMGRDPIRVCSPATRLRAVRRRVFIAPPRHKNAPGGFIGRCGQLSDWTLEGQGTRFVLALTMPASVEPGTNVWFAARWLNAKQQAGPVSTPIAAFVGGGSVTEAA